MATYYDINGQKVQNLASDPSPVTEGQVWYNTVSDTAKVQSITTSAAWSTGGALPVAIGGLGFNAGTQNSMTIMGGYNPAISNYSTITNTYDGTSWAVASPYNLPGRASIGSAGTSTAGLAIGGYAVGGATPLDACNWDGTSWTTNPASINVFFEGGGSFGTDTAAIICSGGPIVGNTRTESYNGTAWTTVNPTLSPSSGGSSSGTQTAGMWCGGNRNYPGTISVTSTADWDGTSWVSSGAMGTPKGFMASTKGSPATDVLIFGGNQRPGGLLSQTEAYDGSVWATGTSQPTASEAQRGAGTSSAATITGGYAPGATVNTFEYTGVGVATTKTITTS